MLIGEHYNARSSPPHPDTLDRVRLAFSFILSLTVPDEVDDQHRVCTTHYVAQIGERFIFPLNVP